MSASNTLVVMNNTENEVTMTTNETFQITIDPFPGEAAALQVLFDASFPIKYGQWFYDSIATRWYEDNPLFSVVARDCNGNVVGAATACMQNGGRLDIISENLRACYVLTVAVEPAWRRRGVARALMAEIAKWSNVQPGCGALYLHVIFYNSSAINLYESLGMQQIRRETDFYPIDEQAFDAFMYATVFPNPVPFAPMITDQGSSSGGGYLSILWTSLLDALAFLVAPFGGSGGGGNGNHGNTNNDELSVIDEIVDKMTRLSLSKEEHHQPLEETIPVSQASPIPTIPTPYLPLPFPHNLITGGMIPCTHTQKVPEPVVHIPLPTLKLTSSFPRPHFPKVFSSPFFATGTGGEEETAAVSPPPLLHGDTQQTLRRLGDSLTCVVCSEIFVEASTLECGHSFCLMCIENWLRRDLTCPVCRAAISRPPTRTLALDSVVEIMVELAEDESQKTLLERKKTCSLSRAREVEVERRMSTLYAQAARAGVRVCHIEKPWSPREQNRFIRGIQHHQACAREAFCGLVGLTHEWVGRASLSQLIVAAVNVGMFKGTPTTELSDVCGAKLRQRIDMFIRFG